MCEIIKCLLARGDANSVAIALYANSSANMGSRGGEFVLQKLTPHGNLF